MQRRVRTGLAFFSVALTWGDAPVFAAPPQPTATQLLPTPPAAQPTRIPDVRRMVDLEKAGVPIYLDAELPVSIDLKALIPAGKYRARVLHPSGSGGWRLLSAFDLQPANAVFGEGCPSTYAELKAVFDSPTADEALRRRATFVARSGVCPKLDAMFNRQTELLAPELVYGITPAAGKDLKLTVERLDDAGHVLRTYEWPLLPPVAAPVVSETEWIVTEVASRMATYLSVGAAPSVTRLPGVLGQFEVKTTNRSAATPVNVTTGPWDPSSYLRLAKALAATPRTLPNRVYLNELAGTLSTPTIQNLLAVNRQLGIALRSDPRNPATHEASALFLVTVAMRASNTGLEDIRPLLNRAAAHLAIASIDGRSLAAEGDLALAGLDALGGREVPAAARLAASKAGSASGAIGSWQRALTMRATGDWRVYNADSKPSLLEQLEHARALARSWTGERAAAFRRDHGQDPESALWARAILKDVTTIELGNELAMPRLDAEQEEVAVLATFFGDSDPAHWLQERAETRGLEPISPDLWARLAEASLADAAWKAARHLDRLAPSPGTDRFRAGFSEALPRSLAFQVLNTWWQLGRPSAGGERGCDEIGRQLKEDAFRLSARLYGLAAQACGAAQRRFPALAASLVPWAPFGTLFDHRNRLEVGALASTFGNTDWRYQRTLSFYDPLVLNFALGRLERRDPTTADYRSFGQELGYSLTLLRNWRDRVAYWTDVSEALEPGRQACLLEVEECGALIDLLRTAGRDEEAFATATRFYAKARPITVDSAIGSPWVVDEYMKRGQVAEALDIADRAAIIGSFSGLRVRARLAERRGEFALAEQLYEQIDEAYPKVEAATFRLRRLFRENKDRMKAAKMLAGLGQPMTLRMNSGQDVPGLIAGSWMRERSRTTQTQAWRLGIREGDLIVKVNGFDITNEDQFWAVLSLDDRQEIAVTVISDSRPSRTALQGPFWHAEYDLIRSAKQTAR